MANIQKCATGTEITNDALVAIVNKALGYPKVGMHLGGGKHADMPASWDGQGKAPPGWTKSATANWVASALSAAVPIPDTLATELQKPASLSLLSAAEQTTLLAAIAARSNVDTETGNFVPKASAAVQAAQKEDNRP
jgi:hypothetical protein